MSQELKVVIIGGVAGGMGCAARLRRLNEHAKIVVFERGPDVSFSNCGMPYYLGGEAPREKMQVMTSAVLTSRYALDIRSSTEITAINRDAKTVSFRNVSTGAEGIESYDKLVISTGAKPIVPPLPGLKPMLPKIFTLRNLQDMDRIHEQIAEGRTAAVVGAGFVGLEVAEALKHRGLAVHLIEMLPQVMAPLDPEMAAPLARELINEGVQLHLGTACGGFEELPDGRLRTILGSEAVEVDFAVLSIGVTPDTPLAQAAGLELGIRQSIKVDSHMRTNDPHIYAVGDAVEVQDFVLKTPTLVPLAGPASRQARIAADNICGRTSTFRGCQGTSICRVFGYTCACTGCNEKTLKRVGRAYKTTLCFPPNRVGVLGCGPLAFKLCFDPEDGKILGAQCVSKMASVDRRIDVIAMAIQAGMTVFDLEESELCYAPPFGAPKDCVNHAGFIASGVLRGDQKMVRWPDVSAQDFILDCRKPRELETNGRPPLPVTNIELDDLRNHLDELPRDRPIHMTCHSGMRAYVAQRMLEQHGFEVKNIMGGFSSSRIYPEDF
eukprot:gnl/Trimastix_PCT/136.p1 GENE.gnl/Trimastix_PCT/136~~gnl/Trimastix_PCT/136.p1  ORF type:complete len:551 (-),score=188.82 gnl/Trimastix_PCT/136:29-1681(-)